MMTETAALLEVEDLSVSFPSRHGPILANDSVGLSVARGEALGIVGESGSGKSVFCRALMRLLLPPAQISAGKISFEGRDLMTLDERSMRDIRGGSISMVFQNPMSSLDPVWTIGDQISEAVRKHRRLSREAARKETVALLSRVGIPSAGRRFDDYPHQWSGGMLQRAVIAMAIAGRPKLLLADEPTTALDVTIQDQILSLLVDLQRESGMSLILVSHDMAVVAETCDRIMVMYAGRVVETASTDDIIDNARHPYTQGLMNSIVPGDRLVDRLPTIPGAPPDLGKLPPGCAFAPRCQYVTERCHSTVPPLVQEPGDRAAACIRIPELCS